MPVKRRFHTNHGLHLNKQGKDWIARNLVKVIRNLHLPGKLTPPIMLPWRDIKENVKQLAPGNQVSPFSSYDIQECQSSGCKNDDGKKLDGDAVSCRPTGRRKIRRSNRVKKLPTNKYQDFLCQTKSIIHTM